MLMEWDWLNDQLRHALNPLYYTPMGAVMRRFAWAWPVFAALHVVSMSVLTLATGALDLGLLGVTHGRDIRGVRRLIRLGPTAFGVALITGIFLVCGAPDQYLFNAGFRWKVVFLLLAGLNLLLFYMARTLTRHTTPAERPALPLRFAAGLALLACVGAVAAGGLATFSP